MSPPAPAPLIVVMGAAGSGKSTVGGALGAQLGIPFLDADAMHSAANIRKMSAGLSLDDADRAPWLARIAGWLEAHRESGAVVACSALRRSHRAVLRTSLPETRFLHLVGDADLLARRLGARTDHFMPPTLVASQLDTLEPLAPDERGWIVDCRLPPDRIVDEVVAGLTQSANS